MLTFKSEKQSHEKTLIGYLQSMWKNALKELGKISLKKMSIALSTIMILGTLLLFINMQNPQMSKQRNLKSGDAVAPQTFNLTFNIKWVRKHELLSVNLTSFNIDDELKKMLQGQEFKSITAAEMERGKSDGSIWRPSMVKRKIEGRLYAVLKKLTKNAYKFVWANGTGIFNWSTNSYAFVTCTPQPVGAPVGAPVEANSQSVSTAPPLPPSATPLPDAPIAPPQIPQPPGSQKTTVLPAAPIEPTPLHAPPPVSPPTDATPSTASSQPDAPPPDATPSTALSQPDTPPPHAPPPASPSSTSAATRPNSTLQMIVVILWTFIFIIMRL